MKNMPVINASIRSYSVDTKSHQHDFHQLVMPLQGVISIQVGAFQGDVGPGDCVIIQANVNHAFSALKQAKFLVIDSSNLPSPLLNTSSEVVSLAPPVCAYIRFVEQQLLYLPATRIEPNILGLLIELLSQQNYLVNKDQRINRTLVYIEENLAGELSVASLAEMAYLSETHFKKRFKLATGKSCQNFIVDKRMNRAKALLLNSDTPIHIIAEKVGYQNQSAFTRRFKQFFGLTPNQLTKS